MSLISNPDDVALLDESDPEIVKRHSQRLKARFVRAVAIDDNDARELGELPFRKGNVIFVLEKSTPNVWKVCVGVGRAGARWLSERLRPRLRGRGLESVTT